MFQDGGLDQETLIFFSLLWFFDFLSVTEVAAGIVRYYRIRCSDQSAGRRTGSFFDVRKTIITIGNWVFVWFLSFVSDCWFLEEIIQHSGVVQIDNLYIFSNVSIQISVLLLLKASFELLLYGHLRFGYLSLVWVMLPLWLFLVIVIFQMSVYIMRIHQKSVSEESR